MVRLAVGFAAAELVGLEDPPQEVAGGQPDDRLGGVSLLLVDEFCRPARVSSWARPQPMMPELITSTSGLFILGIIQGLRFADNHPALDRG